MRPCATSKQKSLVNYLLHSPSPPLSSPPTLFPSSAFSSPLPPPPPPHHHVLLLHFFVPFTSYSSLSLFHPSLSSFSFVFFFLNFSLELLHLITVVFSWFSFSFFLCSKFFHFFEKLVIVLIPISLSSPPSNPNPTNTLPLPLPLQLLFYPKTLSHHCSLTEPTWTTLFSQYFPQASSNHWAGNT